MESAETLVNSNTRVGVATVLYWILLVSFLLSYLLSNSSISLVLTADRLVDAFGMTVALASQRIVQRPPTAQFTYGYHRFESLSSIAMISAFILLLVYSGYVSYSFLGSRTLPDPTLTIYASILSLIVLPVISYLLRNNENLTSETMNIHALQDIVTSAMALGSSVLLLFFISGYVGFASSLLIIAVSVYLNRNLVSRNLRLLMEGTELNMSEIEKGLREKFPMVHHIHVWDVCKHYRLATVHVYAEREARLEDLDLVRQEMSDYLAGKGINHLTVQFEPSPQH